ncbi:Uncharacterised protein [Shigella sonnei]|nr:Uncharacterised protein [Shigella sonnei]
MMVSLTLQIINDVFMFSRKSTLLKVSGITASLPGLFCPQNVNFQN